MYKLKFNDPIHIHFIGIGGISMSGLAEILLEKGFTISGSNAKRIRSYPHARIQRCSDFLWTKC